MRLLRFLAFQRRTVRSAACVLALCAAAAGTSASTPEHGAAAPPVLGPERMPINDPPEDPVVEDAASAIGDEELDQVVLQGGDVLRGRILGQVNGALLLEHRELGLIRIPLVRVRQYGSAQSTTDDSPDAEAAVDAGDAPRGGETAAERGGSPGRSEEASEGEFRTTPWDFYVSFAFAGAFNINDELTLRGGFGARHEDDRTRTTIDAEYYFRVFNSDVTDNNFLAKLVQEWNFGRSPWLFFVQGQYQYDEFQGWEHRISGYLGPGYRLVKTEDMSLTLRVGAGATYEAGSVDEWTPELLLAEDFAWKIGERQTIAFNASIAPNIEDLSDYRIQAQLEYVLALAGAPKGLALTLGLRNIYDSKPDDDVEGNELRIYGGIRYDF
jgi:hypothetical protein